MPALPEVFSITINLNELRAYRSKHAMKPAAPGLAAAIIADLDRYLEPTADLTEREQAFAQKLKNSDECRIVYHPCGSCDTPFGEEGALREYFCSGSGGPDPDHERCDLC